MDWNELRKRNNMNTDPIFNKAIRLVSERLALDSAHIPLIEHEIRAAFEEVLNQADKAELCLPRKMDEPPKFNMVANACLPLTPGDRCMPLTVPTTGFSRESMKAVDSLIGENWWAVWDYTRRYDMVNGQWKERTHADGSLFAGACYEDVLIVTPYESGIFMIVRVKRMGLEHMRCLETTPA